MSEIYCLKNYELIDHVLLYGNKVKNLSIIYKILFDNINDVDIKLKLKEKMNEFIVILNNKSIESKITIKKDIDQIVFNMVKNNNWDLSNFICEFSVLKNKLELLKVYEFLTIENIYK